MILFAVAHNFQIKFLNNTASLPCQETFKTRSRAAGKVKQLTEDQTFVHREILAGRMTEEEAANHPKRNVLLQCIGSSKKVEPEVVHGNIKKDATYLLCSDGFRHELSDEQIASINKVAKGKNFEKSVEKKLKDLVEFDMKNGEQDNITAAVLHVSGVR